MSYYFGMISDKIPDDINDQFIFGSIYCKMISYYPRYEICNCPAFNYELRTECIHGCSHTKIYMDNSYIMWSVNRGNLLNILNIVNDIDKTISYLDEESLPCDLNVSHIFLYMVGNKIIEGFNRFPYEDELLFTSFIQF